MNVVVFEKFQHTYTNRDREREKLTECEEEKCKERELCLGCTSTGLRNH